MCDAHSLTYWCGHTLTQAKAKMSHYKKDTPDGKPTWDSKGVGILMVRTPKEAAHKPFITFTTEAVGVEGLHSGSWRSSCCIPLKPRVCHMMRMQIK